MKSKLFLNLPYNLRQIYMISAIGSLFFLLNVPRLLSQTISISGSPNLSTEILEQTYYVYPESFDVDSADAFDLDDGRLFRIKKEIQNYLQSGAVKTRINYLELPSYYDDYPIKLGYSLSDSSHFEVFDTANTFLFTQDIDTMTLAFKAEFSAIFNITNASLSPILNKITPLGAFISNRQAQGYSVVSSNSGGARLVDSLSTIIVDFAGLSVSELEYDLNGKVLSDLYKQYSLINSDSMVLAFERLRVPVKLRSGDCAEKIYAKQFLKYTYGSRVIEPTFADSTELRGSNANELQTKPSDRIMAEKFILFPNPAGEEVNIMKVENAVEVQICNLQGKVIIQVTTSPEYQSLTLGIKDLLQGVYLIRLLDKNGKSIKTEKLIKI